MISPHALIRYSNLLTSFSHRCVKQYAPTHAAPCAGFPRWSEPSSSGRLCQQAMKIALCAAFAVTVGLSRNTSPKSPTDNMERGYLPILLCQELNNQQSNIIINQDTKHGKAANPQV